MLCKHKVVGSSPTISMMNLLKNKVVFEKKNKIKKNNNIAQILLFKEQFKYLKTTHSYHLVDPSPWPALASLGAFMITSGLVLYMVRPMS